MEGGILLTGLCATLFLHVFLIIQGHLRCLGNGIAHSGLSPPTSTNNQDNPLQTCTGQPDASNPSTQRDFLSDTSRVGQVDDLDIFFSGAVRLHDLCPFPGIKIHEARDKI